MLKKFITSLSKKTSLLTILVIIIGSLTWTLTMVKSGLCTNLGCDSGRSFWGPNGHDGIWHIALSEAFVRGSLNNPVFSGETLRNYHIGYALLLSFLNKLTFIPVINLYFQVLPIVLSVLTGFFVYKLVMSWTGSRNSSLWALIFTYFGGGLGFILTLVKDGTIGGESTFWSQQSISTQVNPPFALSLVLVFAGLYYLFTGTKKSIASYLAVSIFVFASLVQVKIYAAVLMLAALLIASFVHILQRKGLTLFKIFVSTLVVSLVIFPKVDPGTGLVFAPFWFLETMMILTDRVGWVRFGEAMANYRESWNLIKLIPAYTIAFLVFILGNFGTRLVFTGYLYEKIKNLKKLEYLDTIFLTVIFLGIVIPTFYVQKGTPWNTIQFMYYSLIFSGILSGVYFGKYLDSKPSIRVKLVGALVLFFLTIPTTVGTLYFVYLPKRAPAFVSQKELQALHFMKGQPDGVILTHPFDRQKSKDAEKYPPRPLYLYESTAYVSAFSKHDVFLEDEVNLDITGYDWRTRRVLVEEWLKEPDSQKAKDFLRVNNISYIYWLKGKSGQDQRAYLGDSQLGLINIFENEEVIIFKTSHVN